VKKWALGVVLAAALLGLALLLRGRDERLEKPAATPAAAVSALIDAARDGDAQTYLQLTEGELRRSLEQTRKEMGAEGFREHLRRYARGIKGLAVPSGGERQQDTAALDVEIIFADRNERQRMVFTRRGGGWVISSMDTATMLKPPIPYGTPVFEPPPPNGSDVQNSILPATDSPDG
jgi:hypothetical protein